VMEVLPKRFAKYGLTLHPEKTRLVEFGRFAEERAKRRGKKPATFDFLGFTGFSFLASYVWSHAIDNVDPDIPAKPQRSNFTGAQEKGNAIYDQRNRFVLSGFYTAPWKFRAVA